MHFQEKLFKISSWSKSWIQKANHNTKKQKILPASVTVQKVCCFPSSCTWGLSQYIFTASTWHLTYLFMLGVCIKQTLPKGQALHKSIWFESPCGLFPQGDSSSPTLTPAFPKKILCFMLGLYLAHTWHFSYLSYTSINKTMLWVFFRNEA